MSCASRLIRAKRSAGCNTAVCSSQGRPPERGEGVRTPAAEEQASPSACRELRGPAQGHIQHARLPGPSPLQRPHPLREDRASGQGLHERGTELRALHHHMATPQPEFHFNLRCLVLFASQHQNDSRADVRDKMVRRKLLTL